MSRQRETYFYGGGVEIESEKDVSESPSESGSGRASPAPALAAEDPVLASGFALVEGGGVELDGVLLEAVVRVGECPCAH